MPVKKFSAVVTTISNPTKQLIALRDKVEAANGSLFIIGDKKSPADFHLRGSSYFSLDDQLELGFSISELLPENHYARKNIGYLAAMKSGCKVIYETDDDNQPMENWAYREVEQIQNFHIKPKNKSTWVNVYKFYSDENIWPRGMPLSEIHAEPGWVKLNIEKMSKFTIQQGLADGSPDVDAVWRLVFDKSNIEFKENQNISLGEGCFCPFNSQNTWWYEGAFVLMYLPSYCSFRMTDIWRSFIAQRCLWSVNQNVLFRGSDVYQDRNLHNLDRDFKDEIPGYIQNNEIVNILSNCKLSAKQEDMSENLLLCYEALIKNGILGKEEWKLLKYWVNDYQNIIK